MRVLNLDVSNAVKIYYSRIELSNADIESLFGCATSTAVRLKKKVQKRMVEKQRFSLSPTCVPTDLAYEVWGLDIANLEYRYKRLQMLEGNDC